MSATWIILLLTVAVSIAAFNNRTFFDQLAFEPFVVHARKEWWRALTHALIHVDWAHLLVNMFVLYGFGPATETHLSAMSGVPGPWVFLFLYVTAACAAALPSYNRHRFDPSYRSVGASGAVSAVLFSHILIMPTAPVGIFLLPVRMPAIVFGALYLIYEWYQHKRGGSGVAHDAHLMGAVHGLIFTALLEPELVPRLFTELIALLP
ncbi:MAG: rhomboid family intramembrane serine protease [Flavobacteriales bacterium]|nr:rhomboid family intramembrane serine protease [Flavobacteriales bacterium]MBK6752501.1 rhomboid family intramembrane serine protease [Flavobacteriales bacterium]MBK7754151.1 rhomboid family intramembrane serine protease [Flavobacteriales bacterium]MBK9074473.1 rhomboid family intramembrane serine protease [Flavobacteriales bacterium]